MNKLVILREEETNPYYDPRKSRNGGGYHQPQYDFKYGKWTGTFYDSSCGDFGTRYGLSISDGKRRFSASWGTMDRHYGSSSNFPKQFPEAGFYEAFEETFDVRIPTESDDE